MTGEAEAKTSKDHLVTMIDAHHEQPTFIIVQSSVNSHPDTLCGAR